MVKGAAIFRADNTPGLGTASEAEHVQEPDDEHHPEGRQFGAF